MLDDENSFDPTEFFNSTFHRQESSTNLSEDLVMSDSDEDEDEDEDMAVEAAAGGGGVSAASDTDADDDDIGEARRGSEDSDDDDMEEEDEDDEEGGRKSVTSTNYSEPGNEGSNPISDPADVGVNKDSSNDSDQLDSSTTYPTDFSNVKFE